jgi:hypothetical protein
MSIVEQAESSVARLSAEEMRQFRAWFEQFDADLWDREFEDDAASGKLDASADRAIREFQSGRCKEL